MTGRSWWDRLVLLLTRNARPTGCDGCRTPVEPGHGVREWGMVWCDVSCYDSFQADQAM